MLYNIDIFADFLFAVNDLYHLGEHLRDRWQITDTKTDVIYAIAALRHFVMRSVQPSLCRRSAVLWAIYLFDDRSAAHRLDLFAHVSRDSRRLRRRSRVARRTLRAFARSRIPSDQKA